MLLLRQHVPIIWACQTSNPAQPGYCSGMCSNGSGTCQTSILVDLVIAHLEERRHAVLIILVQLVKTGILAITQVQHNQLVQHMTFDSSSNNHGGQISLNLSQISLGSISNAVNAIARKYKNYWESKIKQKGCLSWGGFFLEN